MACSAGRVIINLPGVEVGSGAMPADGDERSWSSSSPPILRGTRRDANDFFIPT